MSRTAEALVWRARRALDRMTERRKERARNRRAQAAMRHFQRYGTWQGNVPGLRGPIWRSRLAVCILFATALGGAALVCRAAAGTVPLRITAAWAALAGEPIPMVHAACHGSARQQTPAR